MAWFRQDNGIGSGKGLSPNKWQAIIWTNFDPVHWHINMTLGGDELTDKKKNIYFEITPWFSFSEYLSG